MVALMAVTLRRGGGVVLDEWDLEARRGREPARDILARRRAREVAEVAVEVRLVVVAAVLRDRGPRLAGLHQLHRAVEAQDPRDGLRRQPDLLAKARGEVAAAAAEFARQRLDPELPVGLLQAPPGPARVGGGRACLDQPVGQET